MIPVNSSHVASVEYDEGTYILTVVFRDGATYTYEHVVPDEWDGLRKVIDSGDSVGHWLHANIRAFPSVHPFKRVK